MDVLGNPLLNSCPTPSPSLATHTGILNPLKASSKCVLDLNQPVPITGWVRQVP